MRVIGDLVIGYQLLEKVMWIFFEGHHIKSEVQGLHTPPLRPNPVYLSSLRVIVAGIVRVASLLIPKKKPVGYALRVRL